MPEEISRRGFLTRILKYSATGGAIGAGFIKITGEGDLLLDKIGWGGKAMGKMTPQQREKFRTDTNNTALKLGTLIAGFGVLGAVSDHFEEKGSAKNVNDDTPSPDA